MNPVKMILILQDKKSDFRSRENYYNFGIDLYESEHLRTRREWPRP